MFSRCLLLEALPYTTGEEQSWSCHVTNVFLCAMDCLTIITSISRIADCTAADSPRLRLKFRTWVDVPCKPRAEVLAKAAALLRVRAARVSAPQQV